MYSKGSLITSILTACIVLCTSAYSQANFSQGFDRKEYADMLFLQFKGLSDSLANPHQITLQSGTFDRILLTKEVGLYNRAGIFLRKDGMVVLQLRGTVNKMESWLENFYAGMVPAQGSLKLADGFDFNYQLADNKAASVHLGWLIGTAFLSREYLPLLDSLVQAGHKNIMVSGHSQGGALSFLTTSFLYYHFKKNSQQVEMKTYASAAPKPGNMSYAYDFDFITRTNGAFRVVNAADWVPETPVSLQTIVDYNAVNPLVNAKKTIRKQKFLVRLYMKNVYNKLDRSSAKAARKYKKFLGQKMYKLVQKPLPQFESPTLHPSMNYATAGIPIILSTDSKYDAKFPFDGHNYFVHHSMQSYMYLLNEWYPETINSSNK